MYIYPDNLKSKATMWLWELKDIGVLSVGFILSVIALVQINFIIPLLATATYGFLTILFDDISIKQFIVNAWRYFIGVRQTYEWRLE